MNLMTVHSTLIVLRSEYILHLALSSEPFSKSQQNNKTTSQNTMFVKFAPIYVIACFAALASASPVPVAAPEAVALANTGILAREALAAAEALSEREPTPEESEDVEARVCRYGCL
ncbi:uncharacterized protein F5891DRAFT_1277941 [Suillus fuscotomentosus]|uniref:Uncharacterized protein n=1 Tax=Suillus fuscotomentosus TaxID=1912939 RepID=A0AAD4HKG7_9AGAM|nr:uncharacterized protein F5891DRAFT_1277941 [Suillus fuscotomentosus]KAG1900975.1 hypothetical protein F5891DRAFT_1277941 [Suillus fuscotomentosus]